MSDKALDRIALGVFVTGALCALTSFGIKLYLMGYEDGKEAGARPPQAVVSVTLEAAK